MSPVDLAQVLFLVLPVLGATVVVLAARPRTRSWIPIAAPVALGAGCLVSGGVLAARAGSAGHPPGWAVLLGRDHAWTAVALAAGGVGVWVAFAVERHLAGRATRVRPRTDAGSLPVPLQVAALPGRREAFTGVAGLAQHPVVFTALTLWTVGTEELLYRGLALVHPTSSGLLGASTALGVQAVFYSINHLAFGWPALFGKIVLGAVLGGTALMAGGIAVSCVLHGTYQLLVWRQFRPRSAVRA